MLLAPVYGSHGTHLSSFSRRFVGGQKDLLLSHCPVFGEYFTKPEEQFKKEPLKGLWHKHYGSSRFMGKNLTNHWKLQDKSTSKKFHEMALETSKSYGQNGFLPTIDSPIELRRFTADLAQNFIAGLKEREDSKELTGEWIVFAKHAGSNYYLTVAHHGEKNRDRNILMRVRSCKTEFPFLFSQ